MSSNKDKVYLHAVLSDFAGMTTSLFIILALILPGCGGEKTGESQADADEEKSENHESDQGNGSEDDEASEETATNLLGDLLNVVKELPIENPGDISNDAVSDVIDLIKGAVKEGGDTGRKQVALSDEEEMEFGEYFHEQFMKEAKEVKDQKTLGRIQRLAAPLFAMLERKDIMYEFTIIKDDEVNAYAAPGGHIYVNSGMLEFVGDNDMELQSLLGHEIGHVDLKHCADHVAPLIRKDQVVGSIPIGPIHVILDELNYHFRLQFSEEAEFAADKYGYIRMRKLGHSKEDALSLDRHLLAYENSRGLGTKKEEADDIGGEINQEVINHFETHPPTADRLKRLEELKIEGIDD